MVRAVRPLIAAEEQAPVARLDRGARLADELDAGVGELLAFLADLLALVVRERREEVGEVAIAGIAPVKLNAVTRDESGGFAFGRLIIVEEEHVQR